MNTLDTRKEVFEEKISALREECMQFIKTEITAVCDRYNWDYICSWHWSGIFRRGSDYKPDTTGAIESTVSEKCRPEFEKIHKLEEWYYDLFGGDLPFFEYVDGEWEGF